MRKLTREMVESLVRVKDRPFERPDGTMIPYQTLSIAGVEVGEWTGAIPAERVRRRVAIALWAKIRPFLEEP